MAESARAFQSITSKKKNDTFRFVRGRTEHLFEAAVIIRGRRESMKNNQNSCVWLWTINAQPSRAFLYRWWSIAQKDITYKRISHSEFVVRYVVLWEKKRTDSFCEEANFQKLINVPINSRDHRRGICNAPLAIRCGKGNIYLARRPFTFMDRRRSFERFSRFLLGLLCNKGEN